MDCCSVENPRAKREASSALEQKQNAAHVRNELETRYAQALADVCAATYHLEVAAVDLRAACSARGAALDRLEAARLEAAETEQERLETRALIAQREAEFSLLESDYLWFRRVRDDRARALANAERRSVSLAELEDHYDAN